MGRFSVAMNLANHRDVILASAGALAPQNVRGVQMEGVVDSAATRLVLPKQVVDQLGLETAGETTVQYAEQRRTKRKVVADVQLEIEGRESVFTAVVEPRRKTALIGAIVLEELDFVVDCTKQSLAPRDPKGIVSEIE